jgi:hypothetical protein
MGVLVDGVPQTLGLDYTESGPQDATAVAVTITFATAPANDADIRVVYFTDDAEAWPDSVNAGTGVKPAAVRGRNICVYLGAGGSRVKLGGVQAAELEATIDGELTREFCNTEPVGRTVNGTDTNGTVTARSKDAAAFIATLSKVTGVAETEVFGWLNQNQIPLTIQIQDPKAPATILKTLAVEDAVFQIPGTPARVNSATDFEFRFESASGTYSAYKGGFLP